MIPSMEELALKFSHEMGWGDFTQGRQGMTVFSFLYNCAQRCLDNFIALDISAGQCRYKPFFNHAQYIAIDSAVGDPDWDFSKLDIIGDTLKMPIKGESIDICLNFTSLEHYKDPVKAFKEFYRILKPGGQLFLYVPFVQVEHQIPHDYYRYTRYGLEYLCAQFGFNIEFIIPSNSIFETALNFLHQAINLIGLIQEQTRLRNIVEKEISPIFKYLENNENVVTSYPHNPVIPQWPVVYCLSAQKPGSSPNSLLYTSREDLIHDITACPTCHDYLIWNSSSAFCSKCKRVYNIKKNGIPDFCGI